VKNFDGWNEVKKKIDQRISVPIKIGEICWCKFGLNIGREQNGNLIDYQRLVIIIKKFSTEFVLVAPLTTKIKKGDWYLDIEVLNQKGQVILNQIKPIDTKRILKIVGQVSEKEVENILDRYVALLKSEPKNV
jgi:mRNA-degrading endonuclease toxin of MazEF toxin-antitoxin module